jgi:hypothetical protein
VANAVAAGGWITGCVREDGGRVRGFLRYPGGGTAIVDAPGCRDTYLQDVTEDGACWGDATDGSRYRAFRRDSSGAFEWVESDGECWAGGILRNRDCCGSVSPPGAPRQGFRLSGGRMELVLPPGAGSATLHGACEPGVAAGIADVAGVKRGFLHDAGGGFEWIDWPGHDVRPQDCGDSGRWVVGHVVDRDGRSRAAECRDGAWRLTTIEGGPWVESSIIGCATGVGCAGWVLGTDGLKRGFVRWEKSA